MQLPDLSRAIRPLPGQSIESGAATSSPVPDGAAASRGDAEASTAFATLFFGETAPAAPAPAGAILSADPEAAAVHSADHACSPDQPAAPDAAELAPASAADTATSLLPAIGRPRRPLSDLARDPLADTATIGPAPLALHPAAGAGTPSTAAPAGEADHRAPAQPSEDPPSEAAALPTEAGVLQGASGADLPANDVAPFPVETRTPTAALSGPKLSEALQAPPRAAEVPTGAIATPAVQVPEPALRPVASQSGDAGRSTPGHPETVAAPVPPPTAGSVEVQATAGDEPAAPAEVATVRAAEPFAWRLALDQAAPAPRAEAPATPAPPAVAQVVVAVRQAREDIVEIRLDPPELGRLQIRLEPGEDVLRVVVMAERPETQDFLRRHAETLIRDLVATGQGQVLLEFAGGTASHADDADRHPTMSSSGPAPEPTIAPAADQPERPSGRLDIRL